MKEARGQSWHGVGPLTWQTLRAFSAGRRELPGAPVHRPCVTSPVPTSVRDRPDVTLAISLPPGKLLSLTHREKQTLPSRSSGPWGCTDQSGVTLSLTLRDGVKTVGGTSALSGSAALSEVEADGGRQGGSGGPGVQTLGKADDEVLVGSGVRYMSRRLELGGTRVAEVTPPTTWGASEEAVGSLATAAAITWPAPCAVYVYEPLSPSPLRRRYVYDHLFLGGETEARSGSAIFWGPHS